MSHSLNQLHLISGTWFYVLSFYGRVLIHQQTLFSQINLSPLPNQPLTRYGKLVSSRSQTNFSFGFYKFFFDTDNVHLAFDNNVLSSVYWQFPWFLTWEAGRSTYNSSKIVVLDSLGNFSSTDNFTFMLVDYGLIIQRRLKLDYDDNLKLYTQKNLEESWVVSWEAFPNPCRIHGICGANSIYVSTFLMVENALAFWDIRWETILIGL